MSRIRANLITNQTANGAPNFTNGLFVTGVATVTNNLNVGGVLTYEDVTNVDSIGIITARSGIDTPSNLLLKTGGSERLRINSSGKVGLGTTGSEYSLSIREADNNNKFLMLQKNSGQELLQIREDGNNHIIFDGSHASGELHFYTAGSERLRIASAGQIGIGGANYGSSGQVLTSQGSGSAVQWASPAAPSVSQNTGTANNNIYQSVATGVTWGSGLNGTEQTVGNIAYCNTSDVYAIDVYLGMTFNHGGGTYNYNSTHCYLTGYLFQSGKNYLNDGSWTHAQHFDMYYNAFGTVYTIPWDPSGTQTLKFRVDYAYNTNTNNTFGFYVISKHLK